jgi:hypothetical protein
MTKVQEQLKAAQEELNKRFVRINAAQADLRQAQAATDHKVDKVADDVKDVAASVGEVRRSRGVGWRGVRGGGCAAGQRGGLQSRGAGCCRGGLCPDWPR